MIDEQIAQGSDHPISNGLTRQPSYSLVNQQGAITGCIMDLSPFGGRLLLPKGASLDNNHLLLRLVSNTDKQCNELLTARALWRKDHVDKYYTEIGCQFVNPTDYLKLKIMRIIRYNQAKRKSLIRCNLVLN